MKKLLWAAIVLWAALSWLTYADGNTYDMAICNVVTNETDFTGKELIGVKWNGMWTQQGVMIEKAFEVDGTICIYNDKADSNITLYLVDEAYIDQIGGVDTADEWDISAQGNITDNRFMKVDGTLGSTQELKFGDGVEKITNYYTVKSTQAWYELSFTNKELNDWAGVTEWNRDMWMQKSIDWLHEIWATQYDNEEDFGADRSIMREEATKFFAQVKQHRWDNPIQGGNYDCMFSDIMTADYTLRSSIDLACDLGVMKGGNNVFMPKAQLTREQALVVAMRMYTGRMLDETIRPWYKNYRDVAAYAGIFLDGELDSIVDERMATRGWVALMLYKAHLAAVK